MGKLAAFQNVFRRLLPTLGREMAALVRASAWRRLAVVAAIAGLAAVGVVSAREPILARIARYWRVQLEEAPEGRIDMILLAIEQTGEAGISSLVAALASPREEVSQSAELALRRQMQLWKTLDSAEHAERAARLADALAAQAESFDSNAGDAAEDLARQILELELGDASALHANLRRDCRRLLEVMAKRSAPGTETRTTRLTAPAAAIAVSGSIAEVERMLAGDLDTPGEADATIATIPSGAVVSPVSALAQGTTAASKIELVQGDGGPEPMGGPSPPGRVRFAPTRTVDGAVDDAPNGLAARTAGSEAAIFTNDASLSTDERKAFPETIFPERGPAIATATRTPTRESEIDVRHAMRQLRATNQVASLAAEDLLKTHGFNDEALQLARAWADPNPAARARVATSVFRTPNVDPIWWLELLATDSDPTVRYAAVSAMASSGNRTLVGRAYELALGDHDLRIRSLAERLAERIEREAPQFR